MEPFSRVWEMGIYEFFNILGYSREKQRREAEAMKKYTRQYGR